MGESCTQSTWRKICMPPKLIRTWNSNHDYWKWPSWTETCQWRRVQSVAVIPDPRYPGYAISEQLTIHFGPPAGLVVTSQDIKDIQVPGLERGTLLITPKQTVISKGSDPVVCRRTGLTCVPAFAMTAHKAEGNTFSRVLVDLPENGTPSQRGLTTLPSFESVYVRLSRPTSWAGLEINKLMSKDSFLACRLDDTMEKGLQKFRNWSSMLGKPHLILNKFASALKVLHSNRLQWFERWRLLSE